MKITFTVLEKNRTYNHMYCWVIIAVTANIMHPLFCSRCFRTEGWLHWDSSLFDWISKQDVENCARSLKMNAQVTTSEELFTKILNPHVGEYLSCNCARMNRGIFPKENADSINRGLLKVIHDGSVAVVRRFFPTARQKRKHKNMCFMFHQTIISCLWL